MAGANKCVCEYSNVAVCEKSEIGVKNREMEKMMFDDLNRLLRRGGPEYRLTLRQVSDVSGADGMSLEVELTGDGPVSLEVTLYPLRIARPEFFPSVKGSVVVSGKGIHKVDIPFEQFDFRQMVRAFLNYLDGVSLRVVSGEDVLLKSISFGTFGDFEVSIVRSALAGNAGEILNYSVMLRNKASREITVNISQSRYGRECLPASFPRCLILGGGEARECPIQITMTEDIPEGGAEKAVFLFVPDGDGSRRKEAVLYASARKAHPYLVLSETEWESRRRAISENGKLGQAFHREYEQVADKWEVPLPAESDSYVYPAYSQNDLFRTVVAWKITGRDAYLKKALGFFEGFLDSRKGYLKTNTSYFTFVESEGEYARGDFKVHRAQSAGWVQEAEFFNRFSVCYDLLHDFFGQEQHGQIKKCMAEYMKFAAWRLTDGDGNNFQVAECGAGLLCAMALQDQAWIQRFLHGYNAYMDLLASVFLDDGMYFEEASGYCRLAGELFFDIVNGAEHFGIPLKDMRVPASYDRNILHSPWAMWETWSEDGKPFLGMSFRRFEKLTSTGRCLKDYFDCIAKVLTEQGIMLSVNDSNEQDFKELYKKAYYLYRDPVYRKIAELSEAPELLFVPEEERETELGKDSVLLEGAGLGLLRDGTAQAALKFGTHGGYHGHYDRLSLASFLKENQTFHNNEYAWFGYDSFLFKMWVQASLAHNMVVVDGRMQKPSACQCVYYVARGKVEGVENTKGTEAHRAAAAKAGASGAKVSEGTEAYGAAAMKADMAGGAVRGSREGNQEEFSAVCAQTVTEWIDPPYGGQTPYPYEFPEEKCAKEGRYILTPPKKRKQGEIGDYSEPVFQRRLLVLFHGYCIVWDYLEGEENHRYDCLYHPMGRFDNEGRIDFSYAERFDQDPFGAGQFIMSCYYADTEGSTCLRFHDAPPRVNGNDIIDHMPEAAVWRAYPRSGKVTVGRYPRKGDSFTAQNCRETMGHLRETFKKTVSFTAEGRTAAFITLLETGKEAGRIRAVGCEDFGSIVIEETDGRKWKVSVSGMDCRARACIPRITLQYKL